MSFERHKISVTPTAGVPVSIRDLPPGTIAYASFNGRMELILVPSEHVIHADSQMRCAIELEDGNTVIGMEHDTPCFPLPDGAQVTITVKNIGRAFAFNKHSCHNPQPSWADPKETRTHAPAKTA